MTKKWFSARVAITYAILFGLAIIVGFPLFWMAISSFKTSPELFTYPPKLIPSDFTTEWYDAVFFRSNAPRLFQNSFVVAVATMVIDIVIATLGAYSVTRFKYPGRNLLMFTALISYLFPAIILLVPMFRILSSLNLVNSIQGIIVTHIIVTLPFALWLLRSFFQSIPRDLEEAALVDGATYLGAFTRIVLPLTAPGVMSTGLFVFILSWNEYLFASVMGTSEANKTLPVGIADFVTSFDIRWGEIMALSTVTTIPVLIFFAFIQKYFVKGLMAGAVKG